MKCIKVALLLLVASCVTAAVEYDPIEPCPKENTTCTYTLTIEQKLTMMVNDSVLIKPCPDIPGKLCYAGSEDSNKVLESKLGY